MAKSTKTAVPTPAQTIVEDHGFIAMMVISFMSALMSRFAKWDESSYFGGHSTTKIFRTGRIDVTVDSYYYDDEEETLYTFHPRKDGSGIQVNRVIGVQPEEIQDALWEYKEELMESSASYKRSSDYNSAKQAEMEELKKLGIQPNSRRRPVAASAN